MQEAGWLHLERCLIQLGLGECIVHQLPVFSAGTKGRGRNGCLKAGADLKVDVLLPLQDARWIGIGIEINGPEHNKLSAWKQDGKRIAAAVQHGRAAMLTLALGDEARWKADIAGMWQLLQC